MRADEPSTPSGDLTGTTQVITGPGQMCGLGIFGGSAASTIIAYDNAAGDTSGTVLWRLNTAAASTWAADFSAGIVFNKGLTVVVAGTGAVGNCYFKKG